MNNTPERFDISLLPELLAPDHQRQEQARRRQSAVWRGERPDQWPIMAAAPLNSRQEAIPDPNFKEAFAGPELMLCSQVRAACSVSNARSDAVPSIRANLGTGVLMSCLGLEQQVFDDKMPWLTQHLSSEQIAGLEPDDIRPRGSFQRGLEYMEMFRDVMGDTVAIYCMDTQGPFDLAHLLLGQDLFYALHDDRPFVHHLMHLCVELGIRTHKWMKEAIGEPDAVCHHSNSLYSDSFGIRICEDTSSLLGPEALDEFVIPYTCELANEFGAWAHYCGRSDALTGRLSECPAIKAINFGHIPGHEHDHPFEQDMRTCLETGTVYFGSWPRFEGESACRYLRRMHRWAEQGCLIPHAAPALNGDDAFENVEDALDFWYGL